MLQKNMSFMIQHGNEPPYARTPPLPPTIRFAQLRLLEDITYRFYVVIPAEEVRQTGLGGWTYNDNLSVTLPRGSLLDVSIDMDYELNTFIIRSYQYPGGQPIQVDTDHKMIEKRVPQNFVGNAVREILVFQQLDPSKYQELGLEDAMEELDIGGGRRRRTLRI